MQKIISKYNNLTKEEKKEKLKKAAMGTGLVLAGIVIGKSLKSKEYEKEINYLNENLDCVESDNFYLEEVIDRQSLKIKEYIDDTLHKEAIIESLGRGVVERDLSIMELVDGNTDRYRGIRSNIFTVDELVERSNELDKETLVAKINYEKYLSKQ